MASATCAAALSTLPDFSAALAEAAASVATALGGEADLLVLFVSPQHQPQVATAHGILATHLQFQTLLGCTGESIVGTRREIEGAHALSLWGARLPGCELVPFHLKFLPGADRGSFVGFPDALEGSWDADASVILLGEPFSFPVDVLLSRWNDDRPGVTVCGGNASGGWGPGQNRLLLGDQVYDHGAVGLRVRGTQLRLVVSQGCRPVGCPMVITRVERNLILELSGKPAMAQLGELWQGLSADDQRLVQQGLHVGRVVNAYQESFQRGDFLILNVIGADPGSGALAIGGDIRAGQTVQFHLRDAASATEDFQHLLAAAKGEQSAAPLGGLLFTCNGRGTRLFETPDHDAGLIAETFGSLPLAGFFAQGEVGPIGQRNFMHGFTASLALFYPPDGK